MVGIRHRPTFAWKKKVLKFKADNPHLPLAEICKYGKCNRSALQKWPKQIEQAEARAALAKKKIDNQMSNHAGKPLTVSAVDLDALVELVRNKTENEESVIVDELALWLWERGHAGEEISANERINYKKRIIRWMQRDPRFPKNVQIQRKRPCKPNAPRAATSADDNAANGN
jgi:hypothetical protein